MSSNQARFVGTIPETYERVLGPFLFDYYARDLAARLDAPAGGRVLEIACGPAFRPRPRVPRWIKASTSP